MKLDKAQQTVVVNKNEYQKYVGVLKETTQSWTMMWKTFCDVSVSNRLLLGLPVTLNLPSFLLL